MPKSRQADEQNLLEAAEQPELTSCPVLVHYNPTTLQIENERSAKNIALTPRWSHYVHPSMQYPNQMPKKQSRFWLNILLAVLFILVTMIFVCTYFAYQSSILDQNSADADRLYYLRSKAAKPEPKPISFLHDDIDNTAVSSTDSPNGSSLNQAPSDVDEYAPRQMQRVHIFYRKLDKDDVNLGWIPIAIQRMISNFFNQPENPGSFISDFDALHSNITESINRALEAQSDDP